MSEPDIDRYLVRRLIQSQFPQWAHLPIRKIEPGGCDNRSFRLGDVMVVRLPSAACYSLQIEKEQRWLPILARGLSVPVPTPLARGQPGEGYPWRWSVYGWLEGETASRHTPPDSAAFARSLAEFLVSLHRINAVAGPAPGAHNFYRGGPIEHYDRETRDAIARLGHTIDSSRVLRIWETALNSRWRSAPVWVHGDMSPDNLLVGQGRLVAVIDFGCCAVGDPACDLALAWTFFGPGQRAAFRHALPLDADTWARGRGWGLWKTLMSLARRGGQKETERTRATLARLVGCNPEG